MDLNALKAAAREGKAVANQRQQEYRKEQRRQERERKMFAAKVIALRKEAEEFVQVRLEQALARNNETALIEISFRDHSEPSTDLPPEKDRRAFAKAIENVLGSLGLSTYREEWTGMAPGCTFSPSLYRLRQELAQEAP